MTALFNEIGLVFITAAGFAWLVRLFKQPPLISYIITGLVLGPVGARLLNNSELFESLRQIGIALLLFLVGLELDWQKARVHIRSALIGSFVQAVASFSLGFYLALLAEQPLITSLYLGLSLAFASTVITVKVLSEDQDLHSLHGRLSIGLLLIQDIGAMIALTFLSGFSQANFLSSFSVLALIGIKIGAVLVITWVLAEFLLPEIFSRVARSQELLFLSSLAWCFIYALTLSYFDFPVEIGALLAGISLASLPYSSEVSSRLRPLRGFFFILLFVALGSSLIRPTPYHLIITLGLIIFTAFLKPVLSFITLSLQGFTKRTAFMTALSQGQLSEFSLLLVSSGLAYQHISSQFASSIVLTVIASAIISTLLLTNRVQVYNRLHLFLPNLTHRPRQAMIEMEREERLKEHVVIFGYHRMGYHILKSLRSLNKQVIIVDFNPDIVKRLREQEIECVYGDIQDEELLESLHLPQATIVISTVPHPEETLSLIRWLHQRKSSALLIVTANHIDDALRYYQLGVGYVILPHVLAGEHVAEIVTSYEKEKTGELLRHRAEEIKLLRTKNNSLYYD